MKKIITVILLAAALQAHAQSPVWPVKKQVYQYLEQGKPITSVAPFMLAGSKAIAGGSYQLLQLQTQLIGTLYRDKPAALEMEVPLSNSQVVTVQLLAWSPGNIIFTTNNKTVVENIEPPLLYRGIIKGEEERNTVLLSVNREYLSLSVTTGQRAIQVTRADEPEREIYRLYNSEKMEFPGLPMNCGTNDNKISSFYAGTENNGLLNRPAAASDKCVYVFVDCSDSLYLRQSSSVQRTISFVYELFNGVITGYYNDSINIQITGINVWSTADPYTGNTRETLLRSMADYYQDNFWGNICVGLDFTSNSKGGLADAIGKVKGVLINTCPAYTDTESAICYNDLADQAIARNFPTGPNTNNSQVYLVMHEIGHLIGSRHTKWCGWLLSQNPDVTGAIDSCGVPEGSCPPGPAPNNGGTIMSYCFQGTSFINYNNGFGPLPGRVIRNFVDQNACIFSCTVCADLGRLLPADNGEQNLAVNQKKDTPRREPVKQHTVPPSFFISQKLKR